MAPPHIAGPPYSQGLYVVRLRTAPGPLRGEVEHVMSGCRQVFDGPAALLVFLAQPRVGDDTAAPPDPETGDAT